MTNQPPQAYNYLHFREYLDGGNEKFPWINWPFLQKSMPVCSYSQYEPHQRQPTAKPNQQTTNNDPEEGRLILQQASHICSQSIGQKAIQIEFPGGQHRSSFRLLLDNGHTIILTRRPDPARATFESFLMRRLEQLSLPTPRHIAFNGLTLIQEDLPGTRLSEALKHASEYQYITWMTQALQSLLDIRQRAEADELQYAIPIIGTEPEWLTALIDRTALLGNHTGIPCPPVPVRQLYDRLILLKPCFTKWDARPGNAMLDKENGISWFDWEHCCARNPMDDMAWLLCDDATPEYPEAESQLIDYYLGEFSDGRNPADASAYLSVFGTHHACIRICRLLDEKAADSWADFETRTASKPGTLLAITQRLCHKASRWSAMDKSTAMLSRWFLDIAERIAEM